MANLDTIPGIGRLAAEIVIAETGGDMVQFPTALRAHARGCCGTSRRSGRGWTGRVSPRRSRAPRGRR
ncbi:transposase [Embleya scabrispora]|uniref:transposase n=1 Tax=Embleya scabrispora TaxID=159449 RepID=UPI003CCC188E